MEQPGFWDDRSRSAPLLRRRRTLERRQTTVDRLNADSDEIEAWLELLAESAEAVEGEAELGDFIVRVGRETKALDLELKLSGEDDERSALLAIHPGEGGTDSQDWAEILLRMYLRWAEQSGFDVTLLERLDGDEAGLKSATVAVRGTTPTVACAVRTAFTGWSGSRPSTRRRGATRPSPRSTPTPRSTTTSTSRSTTRTSASTPSGRPAPAVST